jgi:hypothetical protein
MTPDIADIIAGELKVSRGTAYDMMREALKEAFPVQELVAWVPITETLMNEQHPWLYKTMWITMKDGRVLTGRYEWRQGRNPDRFYPDGAGDEWAYDASHVIPLQAPAHPSTTPPAAQPAAWVGLTDEEIDAIWREHLHRDSRARAIEAKLKEKNHDH